MRQKVDVNPLPSFGGEPALKASPCISRFDAVERKSIGSDRGDSSQKVKRNLEVDTEAVENGIFVAKKDYVIRVTTYVQIGKNRKSEKRFLL